MILPKKWIESRPSIALASSRARTLVLGLIAFVARFRWAGSVVFGRDVKMIGMRRICFGRNVVVGARSWINVNNWGDEGIAFRLGDNSFIGVDNFFTVGGLIEIGPYCLTAKGVSFVGSSHIYENPLLPYAKTGTTSHFEIRIGSNCFFGIDSRVIGDVRVGHGSVIGAGSVVTDDVPAFSLVVGNPGRVIKRYDFKSRSWVRWPADEYTEGPAEEEYLAQLRSNRKWIVQPISAAVAGLADIY